MPGIFGLITKEARSCAEAQLAKMQQSVHREKFYSTGSLVDEQLGIYVGWTALAGSFSDGMPLRNEQSGVALVFSGEDYSDAALRRAYQCEAKTSSDCESKYLLGMYAEDRNFVCKLNGMFHGLLVDRARGAAILFNDRFGMHRLYYHESEDGFYFASEAKAILAVWPELRTPDPRGIGEFVACSCVLENRTIFKDIHVLPAASQWIFRGGRCEDKTTYFRPSEWEEQGQLDEEAYYLELRSVLLNMLPRYFAGRQSLGIAMTGGLDTRVILANHPVAPGALPSYTFRGPLRNSYDVRVGRKIAGMLQQPHRVIEVGDEFLKSFGEYAERSIFLTEGTVDVYRASDLYVSSIARTIAPAKIVGTYGSEIVRQAVMFKPATPTPGVFAAEFLTQVQEARATYTALRGEHPVTFAAFTQSPWYHHGILALEQSQLTVRSPFMDNDFVRTIYRAPFDSVKNGDIRLRLIRDGNRALGDVASDRGVIGKKGILPSMTLAYREFTFKAEYAYDYGMPQSAARIDHVLSRLHLERLFLGRHKLLHFRVWYRDQLAAYVREILLDRRTLSRPYLNRNSLESIVEGHLSGRQNNTTAIHKLLTLELLQRLFFDRQS
jgi:asparagine synthase (glutamine-hydrolysing)